MAEKTAARIGYLDWARGFACLVMFQTHCYDSWLGGAARESGFFKLSQLGGTLPAPLFLFLAGVSFALVTDNLRRKGMGADEIARKTIQRGGEIFLMALLFRLQEFLLGWGHAPWTDLLRVDILNAIGLSLILMGLVCRVAAGSSHDVWQLRKRSIGAAVAVAAMIAAVTPLLWTIWRPHWRAWWLESYINGVHTFGTPQPWLFPLFPWAAFAFVGLAVGFLLVSDWARRTEAAALPLVGLSGAALVALGIWLDGRPVQLYPVYDFWHTSPNFFLVRAGIVMVILSASYLWCRWGAGQWGFSPLIAMGKYSLLVYWVHIEFVYGGLSILPKRGVGIGTATLGLLTIFTAMTTLAVVRDRWKGRGTEIYASFRRAVAPS
jgi:acyltransferase